MLKKGLNELYICGGFQTTASLIFPERPVEIITEDPTLLYIVLINTNKTLKGAVVISNTTGKVLNGLQIKSKLEGSEITTEIASILHCHQGK